MLPLLNNDLLVSVIVCIWISVDSRQIFLGGDIANFFKKFLFNSTKVKVFLEDLIWLDYTYFWKFFFICAYFAASLPVDIGNLKKLEVLNADHNLLTSVPRSIANITNLKTLNLSGNRLHAFPLELCNLRNLDVVDLSSNAIMELPGNIGGLQAVELNLNQNQVTLV